MDLFISLIDELLYGKRFILTVSLRGEFFCHLYSLAPFVRFSFQ